VPPELRITFDDLRIQTKDKELVPFEPNDVQAQYLDQIWPAWERQGNIPFGLRELILKARRFGFSTLIAALFFLDTVNTPNTTTVVVAHDGETTEELFSMVQTMYEQLPPEKQPHKKYDSKRQLTFDHIGSQYLVRTAGQRAGAGRGMTIQNLHCSEAAYYTNKRLYRALLQALAPNGNVFIESTANGESGEGEQYCGMYREASGEVQPQGRKRTPFKARFYPWWSFGEYETDPDPGFTRTDDEITIVHKYDLDRLYGRETANAKLQWRRNKMSEPDMGPNVFPQEYPGDDREAFLVSGSRFWHDWDEDRHTCYPDEVSIEPYWPVLGGYDWGYGAPRCFLLARVDDHGGLIATDELYGDHLTDDEQAQSVVDLLVARGLSLADVPIHADPSMWALKTDPAGKKVQNVRAFIAKGLRMVKASGGPHSRIPRWQNVRRYLHDSYTPREGGKPVPFLRVLKGRCPNLIRTMPLMITSDRDVEDLDSTLEDHAVDTLANVLGARPRASTAPPGAAEDPENTFDYVRRARQNSSKRAKTRKL
jgi:hypothetical protein